MMVKDLLQDLEQGNRARKFLDVKLDVKEFDTQFLNSPQFLKSQGNFIGQLVGGNSFGQLLGHGTLGGGF